MTDFKTAICVNCWGMTMANSPRLQHPLVTPTDLAYKPTIDDQSNKTTIDTNTPVFSISICLVGDTTLVVNALSPINQ